MIKRVKENKDVVKKRNCMCEHPFGTIKRGFNQGYLLLKGLRKVGGEMGFTMLQLVPILVPSWKLSNILLILCRSNQPHIRQINRATMTIPSF